MGASQSTTGTKKTLQEHLDDLHRGASQAAAGLTQVAGTSRDLYKMAQDHVGKAMSTTGGAASLGYFGGAPDEDPTRDLKSYEISLAAATKENVIRGIARAMNRAGLNVDPDADLDQIVRQLKTALPDRKKDTITTAAHKEVCNSIARVLNDEFTPGMKGADALIDTSLDPEAVCRQVLEYVHSFTAGVQAEFLDVYAGVKKALRNIEALDQILKELYEKITGELGRDARAETASEVGPFDEAYRRVRAARDRQVKILENFLHVTLDPAKEELAKVLAEEGETYDLLREAKLTVGTSEFGNALAQAMAGLGSAAQVANRVHKALKEVGLSVQRYLESPDWRDLETALDERRFSGAVTAEDLGSFERAALTLRETFERRGEIADDLRARGGAVDGPMHGGGTHGGRMHGGAAGSHGGEEKSELDRRVEQVKSERRLIFKQYLDKTTRHYDSLLKAIKEMGPKLGREIPLSDKLEQLRDAFSRINDLGSVALDLSLIGFYRSAEARQLRETFLAQLRVVLAITDDIMGLEMYRGASHYFAAVRDAIEGIVKTVDFYTDVVAKKYGGEEGAEGAEVTGGQTPEELGLAEISRSQYDLRESINSFLYFYYVAKVRENLSQTHKELEAYGERYEAILGDAVAGRLEALANEKKARLEGLEAARSVANPAAGSPEAKAWANAKRGIEEEYECKVKFYSALQALDLYMKAFTDAIVTHPDDVKSIKQMLDGVQVIGRWFTEDTGNSLAAFFEAFQAPAPNLQSLTGTSKVTLDPAKHYYEDVGAAVLTGDYPAIPSPVEEDPAKLRAKAQSVLSNFQALKNLVNAFARIGDKFGGQELRRRVFMSPTQIYRVLLEYLRVSAVSVELKRAPRPGRSDYDVSYNGANPIDASGAKDPQLLAYPSVVNTTAGLEPLYSRFQTEDEFFTFMVKAMAAKILTVVGVFDLFERPEPVYNLTPIRTIVGGVDYDLPPEVLEGATELYFRLPRLVEFYYMLFGFKSAGADLQISMIPEMEGVFSGLIRQIFLRSASVAESGDYSDSEINAIVREINGIYEHFRTKDGERAVSSALSSFVMEINRRYGIVKKSEWEKFNELLREQRQLAGLGERNKTDYAILPGEEEIEVKRLAPSDRFLRPGGPSAAADFRPGKYELDSTGDEFRFHKMLYDFRGLLDGLFADPKTQNQFGKVSYGTLIKQAQMEIRRTSGQSEKMQIAVRLIQGARSLTGADVNKAFMFHETVVVGLNTLSAIYSILARFRGQVTNDLNVADIEEKLINLFTTNATLGTPTGKTAIDRAVSDEQRRFIVGDADALFLQGGGVPTNLTAGALGNWAAGVGNAPGPLAGTDATAEAGKKALKRYLIDRQSIMRTLVEDLFVLTSGLQGAVQLRFPNTAMAQIHLDFSKLRSTIESLMADVRHFLDLFRPYFPKEIIQKYEEKATANVGSLYWLEENLVDGLLRGTTDVGGLPLAGTPPTLEGLSREVNKIYTALVSDTGVAGNIFTVNAAGSVVAVTPGAAPANAEDAFTPYGRVFAGLAFYDATLANSGVSSTTFPTQSVGASGFGLSALISAPPPTPGAARTFPGTVASAATLADERIRLYDDNDGLLADRSVLFAFNQLVAKFLTRFYDAPSGKIYQNLINSFANGVFSQSVMVPGHAVPDLVSAGGVFGNRGDPTPQAVLLQSLALVLQRLVKDVNPQTQVSTHLVATLADIPLYMKESYRANLPSFERLFKLVQAKGELLKQLIQRTNVNVGRPEFLASIAPAPGQNDLIVPAAALATTAAPVTGGMTLNPLGDAAANSSEALGRRITAILDAVGSGAFTLVGAGQEVLRELADAPVYLQTGENAIEMYKSQYGRLPLMPLSLSLLYLRPVQASASVINDRRLTPDRQIGTPLFKMQYGTRGLLDTSSAPDLGQMPGVRANLESYNAVTAEREKISVERYSEFVGRIVEALRFITGVRSFRGNLVGANTIARADLPPNLTVEVYSVKNRIMDTIAVVESSYQEEKVAEIGRQVGDTAMAPGLGRDRKMERILNIIDMNIIPVNVHALMRGIALAPTYNYSYTFDQLVALMFGLPSVESVRNREAKDITNSREMFVKLLTEPYEAVPPERFGSDSALRGTAGPVARIFRGDSSLGLGRPKFLSDQIFNKALFGSLYPMQPDWDEAGVSAAAAIQRGRSEWGAANANVGTAGTSLEPSLMKPDIGRSPVGAASRVLTYIGARPDAAATPWDQVKTVDLGGSAEKQRVSLIGYSRWNTTLVRNLFFISNVVRVVRMKLARELTQYRSVLVPGHSMVNPSITEFGAAGFNPPETFSDQKYDSDDRLL